MRIARPVIDSLIWMSCWLGQLCRASGSFSSGRMLCPFQVGRHGNACCFEQRRRNVDEADELGNLLRAVEAGAVDDEGHADRAVVRAALVLLIARHEVAAVIAEEDEDGVVGEIFFLENLADAADRGVDGLDAAVVVRKLRLPGAGQRAQIVGNGGVDEALRRTFGRDGLAHVVLLMGLELRDEEEERLVLLLAQEAFGAIGEEVDAVFILVGDRIVVAIPDRAVIRM